MCSNKRAGQKKNKKKTVGPIKTTTARRRAKQQDEQTANIKHDLLKCTQLFIGTGHGHRVGVGVEDEDGATIGGCTWSTSLQARRFMHCGRTLLLAAAAAAEAAAIE